MNIPLENIHKPSLLLDEIKCRENIRRMAEKARRLGVLFRPHFKTHQSKRVGRWFREEGVSAITVSSVSMAAYFIEDGWDDITIAFPLNIRESSQIINLSAKARLNILVTMPESLEAFSGLLKESRQQIGVFIKIDTGYHRTGLQPSNEEVITKIISICDKNPLLAFKGFLTHTGQTYQARGREEIETISREAFRQMLGLKTRFGSRPIILSIGDTPACSILENFQGMDEIRPGNFIFYDVMQTVIGSCETGSIAVCLSCPVVSKDASRNEILIFGGAVHLSKESLMYEGHLIFGLTCMLSENGWSPPLQDCYVSGLSQEHGIVKVTPEVFSSIKPGDLLGILPVHSCLTAQCMGSYLINGELAGDHM
jgi:D-serine deaminase-like pyridoxal phosphate-dependent protein